MSERTVDAGRAIAHGIYAPINRWTESDALDPMFEKPQKDQVVRTKIEAVSLYSTSMAPSLDGPLLPRVACSPTVAVRRNPDSQELALRTVKSRSPSLLIRASHQDGICCGRRFR